MALEKGKIPSSQLVMLVLGFTVGSSLVITPGKFGGQDAWLIVLLGLVEGLLTAWVYVSLALRFPGRTFVQLADEIFGKYLGKVVSAVFLLWVFHLGTLVVDDFCSFAGLILLPNTPQVFLMGPFIWICASAVRNGIEVIGRTAQILVPFAFLNVVLSILFLAKDMALTSLQPILNIPVKKLLWVSHGVNAFPFAETVVFLMVLPFINKVGETKLSVAKGLVLAGLTLSSMAFRDAAVLGGAFELFSFSSYQAIRLISVTEVFTRLEILVVINMLMMGYIKLSVLLYGTALGVAQLSGLRSYLPVVLPLSILMCIGSLMNFCDSSQLFHYSEMIWPIVAPPFQLGIPLLALLVAVVRRLPKEEGQK